MLNKTDTLPTNQISADSGYAGILQRMESGHSIALAHSKTLFTWVMLVGYIISAMTLVKGIYFDWVWHIFTPLLSGAVAGSAYYVFSLRRWHKMITSIRTGDFDGDGKSDVVGKRVIYIKVDTAGYTNVVATDIPEEWKTDILTVARAFNADPRAVRGLTSQTQMRQNHGIGRKKLQKIMGMFLQLDIIEKKGPKSNDPYTLKNDSRSETVMRAIAHHDFKELTEVWESE